MRCSHSVSERSMYDKVYLGCITRTTVYTVQSGGDRDKTTSALTCCHNQGGSSGERRGSQHMPSYQSQTWNRSKNECHTATPVGSPSHMPTGNRGENQANVTIRRLGIGIALK